MKTLYVTACAFLAGISLLGCSANSLSLRKCGGSVRADTRVAGVSVLRASWQPAAGGRNRLTDPQDRATTQATTQAAEQPYTVPRNRHRRRSYLELRRIQKLRRSGGGIDDQSIANTVFAPGELALQPPSETRFDRSGTIILVNLGESGLLEGLPLGFLANQNLFTPTANPLAPVCGQLVNARLVPNVAACRNHFPR